jgi:hypothetical protein
MREKEKRARQNLAAPKEAQLKGEREHAPTPTTQHLCLCPLPQELHKNKPTCIDVPELNLSVSLFRNMEAMQILCRRFCAQVSR